MKRRTFLKTTAIGAAAAATAPMILTSCSTVKGANDRVNFGHIGLGNRGADELTSYFLRWPDQIRSVAFCDVFKSRRENALGLAQKAYQEKNIQADLKAYNEFERILERKDIDAVAITTPDHWHVPLAIMAAQAGKHLHVAKPLGLSHPDFVRLTKECKLNKVLFNYGTQQRSYIFMQQAIEMIKHGDIGKIERVDVWCPRVNPVQSPVCIEEPVPPGLDYDRFVGPAPFHPYCPARVDMQSSYFIYDYSLGFIAGWGAHPLDIMEFGIKDQMTGNYTCEGTGGFWAPGGIWDTINSWDVNYEYANDLKLHFMSDEIAEPLVMKYRPKWDNNGTTFFGTKGWISLGRSTASSDNPEIHKVLNKDANADGWIKGEGAQLVKIFTDTIKGNKPELCPLDDAILSDTISHMGNIAIRTGRKITWYPEVGTIPGDLEAMKMFVREHRKPWAI
ncbi:MAG: Gfo/Idh/MocA family oxidoreductase [Bacteroidales bacterium]